MLLFGHTGITLGVAVLLAGITTSGRSTTNEDASVITGGGQFSQATAGLSDDKTYQVSRAEALADYADIRLLLVGSLLPDIIDKPVGQFFFRETFGNGRIFSHTLLFLTIITLIGLYLYRYRSQRWLLVLSFGTLTHLVFDQMWRAPHTLLWPIYGFAFEMIDLTGWVPNMLHALLTDPEVYLPELMGGAILLWLVQSLVRRRSVFAFLK